jgi:hypothetical protein
MDTDQKLPRAEVRHGEIPEVFISVEGGVVQGVTIKNAPCIVRVYDFDIDGVDEADLSKSLDGKDDCVLAEYGPNTGDY